MCIQREQWVGSTKENWSSDLRMRADSKHTYGLRIRKSVCWQLCLGCAARSEEYCISDVVLVKPYIHTNTQTDTHSQQCLIVWARQGVLHQEVSIAYTHFRGRIERRWVKRGRGECLCKRHVCKLVDVCETQQAHDMRVTEIFYTNVYQVGHRSINHVATVRLWAEEDATILE